VAEFLVGPKRTALEPGELVVAVRVPIRRGPQDYLKVGVRNAMVIAVASVALSIDLDARRVGVGLGSVGPTALPAPDACAWLESRLEWQPERVVLADPDDRAGFGARVAAACAAIDDHRGTAAYRRRAVGTLAVRALRRALT
jgi:CO/xanthine dehydrogenase FAD-binding subunit